MIDFLVGLEKISDTLYVNEEKEIAVVNVDLLDSNGSAWVMLNKRGKVLRNMTFFEMQEIFDKRLDIIT